MPIQNRKKVLKLLLLRRVLQRLRKSQRTMYIRDIFEKRGEQGEMNLVRELKEDPLYHFKYFRMTKENFNEMFELIRADITSKQNHRRPITPLEKLAITIRYLATGNSQISLAFNFRVSPQSVSVIVREVMTSICKYLGPIYLKRPTTEDWEDNEAGFRTRWNYPNAIGAIDGKHVKIRAPKFAGSVYYNYKHFHSIVLLGVVDPFYKFTVVDIGASGSQSDGGVFSRSEIGKAIEDGSIGIPEPKEVGNKLLPHVILSDDAFSLKPTMMKPYPGTFLPIERRIFNYRLSRGRMVVENAFGVLAARWRIFHTSITADLELTRLIVQTSVILHNYLITKKDMCNITVDGANGESGNWRDTIENDSGLDDLPRQGTNNFTGSASQVREDFCHYFNNEGAVSWQNDRI